MGSSVAWADNLIFDGTTLIWNTSEDNKSFADENDALAAFASGDNVSFTGESQVSLGENITAGTVVIEKDADVTIDLGEFELDADRIELGGTLDMGDSLSIGNGSSLEITDAGAVLDSNLVLGEKGVLTVTGAGGSLNGHSLTLQEGASLILTGAVISRETTDVDQDGELSLIVTPTGDGKTYTLLSGVSALVDKAGNSLTIGSYSIDELFDSSQPGSGFWAGGTLVYAADGTLTLIRYNETVKDALDVTTRQTSGADYQYYKGLTFSSLECSSSSSSAEGGAIYGASITFRNNGNVVFEGNTASATTSYPVAYGGAISGRSDNSMITLSYNGSVVFIKNTASASGTYSPFDNYGAYGGAIYGGNLYGGNGSITLSNNCSVMFSENMAYSSGKGLPADGGAIFGDNNITLSNNGSVTFCENSANSSNSGARAGAIACFDTLEMDNNGSVDFIGNKASSSGNYVQGGAIYGDNKITMNNNGSVTFIDNIANSYGYHVQGGAIYCFGAIMMNNNGCVIFRGNTALVSGSWSAYGGAIYAGKITLSHNGSVAFIGNKTSSSGSFVHGGAMSGATVTLSHNDSVTFIGNSASSVSSSAYGGAINTGRMNICNNGETLFWGNHALAVSETARGGVIHQSTGGVFCIQNNASVVFGNNYILESNTLRLQSIWSSDAFGTGDELLVDLSAPKDARIEFRDSIYINVDNHSDSAFHLNNRYENDAGEQLAQTGDIIFTGTDATAENLKAILAAHGINREATADEIRLSKTSEIRGTMQLHDGRLIIRDGAILRATGITVHDSASGESTPTLWLDNGELGGYNEKNIVTISGDSALRLSGQNTAMYSTLTLSTGSTLIIDVAATHAATAALTLDNGTLTLGGGITLQLNAAEGLAADGRYILLSGVSAPTDWVSHITVSGGVWSIDDLSWVNNTLYLNYPTLTEATWNNASGDWVWNVDSSVNWEQHELNWAYRNGIGVIFGDEACGTVELVGNLAPKSVLVNNGIGKDYVFSGTGSLTDSMKLTKEGTGTLHIKTTNSYTGGTEIKGGVLVVDNPKALGTGEVVLNGGTLEIAVTGLANTLANTGTSTLKVSNGKTHSLAGTIDNSGELTLEGLFDATTLATTIGETHIDATGQEGNSGFLKTAGKEVDIMTGSGTLVNNGTVSIGGTTVTLDDKGYGKTGAELQLGSYTIVDGTHSVAAILDKSTSANIILNTGGTLTADASTEALTATGGVINMNEAIELGGSISGAVLNVSAGKLTAVLSGENTLNATGWQMDHTITNNGTLTLSGTVDATALATAIDETHIDADGQEGNSGFLKTAGKEVDIMTGSGTLVNNGTVSIGGTTVTLDAGGYGKTGAELQLGTYTIVDGTHSVEAILGKSATAEIVLEAGTLTADASTNALNATGGTINMDEAIELGGSISGTELNISAGKLTATLSGENTLNATGWQMDHTITNNGTLTLEGTVDATTLATAIDETHIDATGREGNSGFLKTAGKEVDIMTGSGTLVNNGTVSIDGTTVTLDDKGYGKTGAELQLGTYTIVDGTHSVEAILRKSVTANIILEAGTLTADASTDALTTTGGIINMSDAIELGGSISGTELNVSAGKLTATLSGENTLNATDWSMSLAITNNGTLTLEGTVDASALATTIGETHIDATGREGNSGFLKTAGKGVDIMTGSGTLVNNGTVSIDGTTVTLDDKGYGKTGAELQLGTYTIVDGTHSVEAILRKSATANIILESGTLTADASTDALTATGGIINMSDAIELGGSISGTELNISAGKLTAVLSGENTLNATDWIMSLAITNNGILTLEGTVDATTLATTIGETHIDATGQEGNSGFLKTAGKEVDIMTGSGTLVNNGTVSIDGTTVTLDDKGYGKTGAELQLGTYTIVDGTHSVEAILRKSATANIILESGTLTADASTDALTATGGIINMSDAIELGGSISGAELNVSAGKLTATLEGENTLNATGWNISQTIINTGTLTLSGSIDASALQLNKTEAGRLSLSGERVGLTESGFSQGVEYTVLIVDGGSTVNAGAGISHKDYLRRTQLVLGEDGVARAGAEVDYTHYFLTGGDSAEVSKIAEVSERNQAELDGVTMDSGLLTVDQSITVSATGGSIVLTEAATLGGSIENTAVSSAVGDYVAEISALMSGDSALVVNGGEITVSGANSYTGGTQVNGGALMAGNAQAFGTGDVVVNNATLDLNQFSIANKVFMNGSSTLSYADGASHIVLGSGAAVNFRNGYTLGSGKRLTVAGPASYTGALTLGGGTLELGGQLTVQGDVVFASGATTTLDISGWKGLDDGEVLADLGSSNSGYADGCLTLEGVAGDWELAFDSATGVLTLVAVKDEPMPEPEPEPMPEPMPEPEFKPELNPNQQIVFDTVKDIMDDGKVEGLLGELGKEITNTRDEEKLKELLDALGGAEYATLMSSQQDAARGHMRRLRNSLGNGWALMGTRSRAHIEIYHNRMDVDGDSHGRGYELNETGGQFSVEFIQDEKTSGGFALASGRSRLQPDGGMTQHSDNTYVDAFLMHRDGGYTARTSLGVGVHSYELDRNVMGNAVSAETEGSSVNFMHESAYAMALDESNSVQVFGAVESSLGKLGAFHEKGADTASLQVKGQDAWMTTLGVGARYMHHFAVVENAPSATLSLQAGVEYKLGDTESEVEVNFSGARRNGFKQSGTKRDIFGYNLGASLHVPVSARAAVYASGDAVLRGDSSEVNANLGVQVAF